MESPVGETTSASDEIAKSLRQAIRDGQWAVGARMAPIRNLAQRYQASLSTVHAALRRLQSEGMVHCAPRRTATVKSRRPIFPSGAVGLGTILVMPAASYSVAHQQNPREIHEWARNIVAAIERGVHKSHFQLTTLPHPTKSGDITAQRLEQVHNMGAALKGVICLPMPGGKQFLDGLDKLDIPWVTINLFDRQQVYNFVTAGNIAAGMCLGHSLAKLDIGRVVVLAYDVGGAQSSEMEKTVGLYRGFLEAKHSTSGIEVVEAEGIDQDSSRKAMRRILASDQPAPQAVFALGDVMALGAIRGCLEAGLRVPEDVVVIGGTGLPLAEHTHPSLATLDQPMDEIGLQAVAMLVAMDREGTRRIVGRRIPSRLVLRESFPVPEELRRSCEERYKNDLVALDAGPAPESSQPSGEGSDNSQTPARTALSTVSDLPK